MNKLDILNRSAFVEQLVRLVDNISINKSSTCFAINGQWGCGKSFVLDLFQDRLEPIQSEETNTDKYFVIRYNSWKFDYYEEPLVAIVSTLMAAIDEKTKRFPDSKENKKLSSMLKGMRAALRSIANDILKEITGVDAKKSHDAFESGKKEDDAAYEREHSYDVHFGFNKVIARLAELLEGLSRDYTTVFIVDELDRCIPEYAIKVLERLHHLTENQSNIITIMAIDKQQLTSSVTQLFGFSNPEKYLEKFINFELTLDNGSVSELITEKYADYIALFDKDIFQFEDSVEECLQAIFKGIDIRTQERLVKKAMIAHKLLFSEKQDYLFMCIELIIAALLYVSDTPSKLFVNPIKISDYTDLFSPYMKNADFPFQNFFKKKLDNLPIYPFTSFTPSKDIEVYNLPDPVSLYGAILLIWSRMHRESSNEAVRYAPHSPYEKVLGNINGLRKYAETIILMK